LEGVNSLTGTPPPLAPCVARARASDALLYVDDAHGFGVVGSGTAPRPARMAAAATGWCAIWASATSTWC